MGMKEEKGQTKKEVLDALTHEWQSVNDICTKSGRAGTTVRKYLKELKLENPRIEVGHKSRKRLVDGFKLYEAYQVWRIRK